MWQRFPDQSFAPEFNLPTSKNDGCALGLAPHKAELYCSSPALPCSAFIPERYERNYRYPLVVFLHDDDQSELTLQRWFPAISDTNFLALGVRAPFLGKSGLPGRYRWQLDRPEASGATIREAIAVFCREWHVHPERMTLLGEGVGAAVALQVAQQSANAEQVTLPTFAGVACYNLPEHHKQQLTTLSHPPESRILLCDQNSASDTKLSVSTTLNHWLMSLISTTVY